MKLKLWSSCTASLCFLFGSVSFFLVVYLDLFCSFICFWLFFVLFCFCFPSSEINTVSATDSQGLFPWQKFKTSDKMFPCWVGFAAYVLPLPALIN